MTQRNGGEQEAMNERAGMMRGATRWAAVAVCVLAFLALALSHETPQATAADFGIAGFDGVVTNEDGSASTQAGAHPYQASTTIALDSFVADDGATFPNKDAKDFEVELPPGFIVNPSATPKCNESELEIAGPFNVILNPTCPPSTQVGVVKLDLAIGFPKVSLPVFNVVPPPGRPAQLAFNVLGQEVVHVFPSVRSDSDFGITADIVGAAQTNPLSATELTLWGVPADPSHNAQRGQVCITLEGATEQNCFQGGATAGYAPTALLSNSTSCSGPQTTTLHTDSWSEPSTFLSSSFVSHDSAVPPRPIGIEGCDQLPFAPTFSAQPTVTRAEAPTGLNVAIHVPQEGLESPDGRAAADLKTVKVVLPQGMTVNPSSADGLNACSEGQIGFVGSGFSAPNPVHFNTEAAQCPESSRIGSVEINTPLLEKPLSGSVYLAGQGSNPFGSLLALYLVAEGQGITLKLPGKVDTGPGGQLTATFDNNPQIPFEDLRVSFFDGSRAALVSPPRCGTYTTTAQLTPWSGTAPVNSTSSFQITSGPNGIACPNGNLAPKLEAGTTNPIAGKYSPFVLNLSREDGTQQLSTITAALPQGLLGKLAGIPYCSDSALGGIPTAEGTGAAQLANPSCPSGSQLGTVSVGAGAGPSPFYVNTGKVYLAGPYKGAPLSLAIVTPALAGPFDLGNVVVRAALQVNPETTQITAVSDPLPTILQGIPLDLRSVAVNINREGFTLNPTSCDPMEVASTIGGTGGGVAHPSSRFQVASCESLGFAPKLALNLKGGTSRAKDPALKAVLTSPSGQANIGKVQVILPKSVFIDQRHVDSPCTRVQFNAGAGNGSACPAKSILGKATAYSPLLAEPLKGNVYFRSNGGERKLPDLVASLNGQIHVNLVGFIDSVHQKGTEGSRVRNTFASVPDAPVSKFVLELQGGKKGLLQNSTNLCKTTNKATVKMDGQNGKVNDFETVVKPACGQKSKAKTPKKK